jgi:hypothetical protein
LAENKGVVSKEQERAYYDNLLAQMDRDIAIKNGVTTVQPQPKGKR